MCKLQVFTKQRKNWVTRQVIGMWSQIGENSAPRDTRVALNAFGLAIRSSNGYSLAMLVVRTRKVFALLAAMVLAAGLITHALGAPSMVGKSAMTSAGDMPMSSEMPMPGKCNGCAGDEQGTAPAACSAFCSAVIAVPAVAAIFAALPIDTLGPSAIPIVTGRADPPDPYPPRTTILS
jgi:hypothetical protein